MCLDFRVFWVIFWGVYGCWFWVFFRGFWVLFGFSVVILRLFDAVFGFLGVFSEFGVLFGFDLCFGG